MAKRQIKPRLYNGKTMTEAQMFSMIRSALRALTVYRWKPIQLALNKSRRRAKRKRVTYEYLCCECKEWYPKKDVQVDHKIPAGQLRSFDELGDFARRLFCEEDDLQVMCRNCHKHKTNEDKLKSTE